MLDLDPDDCDQLDLFTWTCGIRVRERKKLGLKTEEEQNEGEGEEKRFWRSGIFIQHNLRMPKFGVHIGVHRVSAVFHFTTITMVESLQLWAC